MDDALAKRRYRIGLRLSLDALRWMIWPLAIGVAVSLVLAAVLALTGAAPDGGVWAVWISIAQWLWGAAAGIRLFAAVPVHLALGVTRRETIAAFGVFGALTTALGVVVAVGGFLAEHAVLLAVADPDGTWGAAALAGTRYLLITPIYFFGGAAIAAAALRFGSGPLPAGLILILAGALYTGALFLEFAPLADALPLWTGACLVLLAALAAAFDLALRSAPIRPRGA
ncbi:hypothetical protein [Glycomyces paridis]|uniref:Uncharacterized protein n=1 Tax=Glycomyces paridis TaxID=2126555 RepID=A0A4S8PJB1_9ACTN|nr:hypothetical protein [Glycomyces paridis]THV30767.1 hypothetical protein E9998_05130 [Glycomyces paridis]